MLDAVLVAVILVNTLALILRTEPALGRRYAAWLRVVEYIAVTVFVAEYALRLWAAPEADPDSTARPWRQRVRYAHSFAALTYASNLSFLLLARLLTRTVKLAHYFHSWRRPFG